MQEDCLLRIGHPMLIPGNVFSNIWHQILKISPTREEEYILRAVKGFTAWLACLNFWLGTAVIYLIEKMRDVMEAACKCA